jgi:hypothetical protein
MGGGVKTLNQIYLSIYEKVPKMALFSKILRGGKAFKENFVVVFKPLKY